MKAKELTQFRMRLGYNYKEFGQWLATEIASQTNDGTQPKPYSRQRVYDWEKEHVAVPAKVEAAILRYQLDRVEKQMEQRQKTDRAELTDDEKNAVSEVEKSERRLARASDTFRRATDTLNKVLAETFTNASAAKAFVEFQLQNDSKELTEVIESTKFGDIPLNDREPLAAFYRLGVQREKLPLLEQASDLYRRAYSDFKSAEAHQAATREKEVKNLPLRDQLEQLEKRLERDRDRGR
ncbi:MAG: hypothetical protein AAGB04_31470 [Pseudomonadota bacterium]